MNVSALFGISTLMSFMSSGVVAQLFAWPRLRMMNRFAIVQGLRFQIDPGALGAAFFIPTAVVPPLLVTHALIFRLLVRPR